MKKTKMTLAVIGGVFGVAILAMLYMVWSAYSNKVVAIEGDEETNGLESVQDDATKLSKKPVYPCKQSVEALESNRTSVVNWCKDALKLVSAGDRAYEKTTPAAFKTFIVSDAKRIAALPGAVNGLLVKPDFSFGPFKDYIVLGNMPADDKLAELQRRWDDVTTIVDILAKSGISELTDIQYAEANAAANPEEENLNNKKKAKTNSKNKAGEAAPIMKKPSSFTYSFVFYARPSVFIQAVNAIETATRFITIDDFTLLREKDVIAEALGGGEAKSETHQTSRRRRRGREAAEEQSEESEKPKHGIVIDPAIDVPIKVQMTVSVYDFRSLESAVTKEEEVKKEVAK